MRIITKCMAVTINKHRQYFRIGTKDYGLEIKYSRLTKYIRLNKGVNMYHYYL